MVIVTAGYHRYFSHRRSRPRGPFSSSSRVGAQTRRAEGGDLVGQPSPLAPQVLRHAEGRSLRPRSAAFWYSHVGWVLSSTWTETDPASVKDLSRFPELRFLDRATWQIVPMVARSPWASC